MDQWFSCLGKLEHQQQYKRRNVARGYNQKKSKSHKDFIDGHPSDAIMAEYRVIDNRDGNYFISRIDNNQGYLLDPNPHRSCNKNLCIVYCHHCPGEPGEPSKKLCKHEYR